MKIDDRNYVPGDNKNAALNEASIADEDLYTIVGQSEFAPGVSFQESDDIRI